MRKEGSKANVRGKRDIMRQKVLPASQGSKRSKVERKGPIRGRGGGLPLWPVVVGGL